MSRIFLLHVTLSIWLLSGCGGSESSNTTPLQSSSVFRNADTLSLEDFNVTADAIEAYELTDLIEEDEHFMNAPLVQTALDSTQCLKNVLNSFTFEKNSDGTYRLNIPPTDVTACFYDENNLSQITAMVSYHYDDFTAFLDDTTTYNLEGLSGNDIENINFQKKTFRYFTVVDVNGSDGSAHSSIFASTGLDDFDKPCIHTKEAFECTERSVKILKYSDGTKQIDTNMFRSNVLVSDKNSSTFGAGTIDFVMNNWNGTMNYHDTALPTYTATNGHKTFSNTLNPEAKWYSETLKDAKQLSVEDFNVSATILKKSLFKNALFLNSAFATETPLLLKEIFIQHDFKHYDTTCVNELLAPYTFEKNDNESYTLFIPLTDLYPCYKYNDESSSPKELVSIFLDDVVMRNPSTLQTVDLEGMSLMDTTLFNKERYRYRAVYDYTLTPAYLNSGIHARYYYTQNGLEGFDTPCLVSDNGVKCISQKIENPLFNEDIYNIEARIDTTWSSRSAGSYNGGSVDFKLNDWHGSITYNDSDTEPAYNASNDEVDMNESYRHY